MSNPSQQIARDQFSADVKSRRQNAAAANSAQQQQQAGTQQQQAAFAKARAACLEGKGYTVK